MICRTFPLGLLRVWSFRYCLPIFSYFQHSDGIYPGHVHARVHVLQERQHRHKGRADHQKSTAWYWRWNVSFWFVKRQNILYACMHACIHVCIYAWINMHVHNFIPWFAYWKKRCLYYVVNEKTKKKMTKSSVPFFIYSVAGIYRKTMKRVGR